MYPIMLSDTSLGLGLAPETTCQFRTPALERPARNQTINIFIFFLFFAENTLRHLRTPRNRLEIASSLSLLVYRCECTLYFSSPQQFFFSPLLRTDSRRNKYKFYILFLRVFSLPSIFSLQGTYFSLLDPSFFGQDLIYTITRTRLDLCNFYGRSVRISARYKTPNPPCSSSPFYLLTFSLSVSSPQKYHLCKAHSLITSLSSDLSSRGFQIKL